MGIMGWLLSFTAPRGAKPTGARALRVGPVPLTCLNRDHGVIMTKTQPGSFSISGALFAGTLAALRESLAREPIHASSPLICLSAAADSRRTSGFPRPQGVLQLSACQWK